MRLGVVQRILGLLLMLFSITMLPAVAVSWFYEDGAGLAFLEAFSVTLIIGLLLWLPARRQVDELRRRDGYLIVAGFWIVLSLVSALPFLLLRAPEISLTDAIFESVSGLTTTGSTILSGLDSLPKSVLFWRASLNWLGGVGIIILAVAILPMLGIGGMQLYRAEAVGPAKESKLAPRITETAKALWYVYVGLTVACALAFYFGGMDVFDAICHAFATLALGGFSTHDASLGYFDSSLIYWIAAFFTFLAGVNFALHFVAVRDRSLAAYLKDEEFRVYLYGLLLLCLFVSACLYLEDVYTDWFTALTNGTLQTASIAIDNGLLIADISTWPGTLPALLMIASCIGGCAGSTCGGLKVMRAMLLYRQVVREIRLLLHPNAIVPVKLNNENVPSRVIQAVWGYFAVYAAVFVVLMVVLMTDGVDQVTAFSAIAASINNMGAGLGAVAANFGSLSDLSTWTCIAAMLLGRLEIFPLLVIMSPAYWQE